MAKKVVYVVVLVVVFVVIIARAVFANPAESELRRGIASIGGRAALQTDSLDDAIQYRQIIGANIGRAISSDIFSGTKLGQPDPIDIGQDISE